MNPSETATEAQCTTAAREVFTPFDFRQGDAFTLGKRSWAYQGRSEDIPEFRNEQNEFVFIQVSPEPGAVDRRRVMAQSELQALLDFGVVITRISRFTKWGPA